MEELSKFCFLCLNKIDGERDVKAAEGNPEIFKIAGLSLQCIHRYLNIDPSVIDSNGVRFSESEVQLCPGRCLDVMCKFKELFESLEEIQMKTEACLETVLECLEAHNKVTSDSDGRHQVLYIWRKLILEKGLVF